MTDDVRRGTRVRIPAGVTVTSTHPRRRTWTTKRSQVVTVHHLIGYDILSWPGKGGYWCDVPINAVEVLGSGETATP
jgi:hypothetical protein